jgi:hypothetical protein
MTLPAGLSQDSDVHRYVNSDYERSRATLFQLLEDGKEALQLAMEIAKTTEHPQAVLALSNLFKNIGDINDKIMDLNRKHKEYYRKDTHRDPLPIEAPQGQVTNHNYLFSGTVADLQKHLAEMPSEIIDVTPNE